MELGERAEECGGRRAGWVWDGVPSDECCSVACPEKENGHKELGKSFTHYSCVKASARHASLWPCLLHLGLVLCSSVVPLHRN